MTAKIYFEHAWSQYLATSIASSLSLESEDQKTTTGWVITADYVTDDFILKAQYQSFTESSDLVDEVVTNTISATVQAIF